MKKIVLFLSCIALLSACRKDDDSFSSGNDNGQVSRISYTVEATYGEKFNNLKASGAVVKLIDTSTGQQYEATTSDEGKAILQLLPGTYNIEVSKSLTKEQNNSLFGFDNEANFAASKQGVTISRETNFFSLKMSTSRMGDLVIKQIYYTGSNLQTAAKYFDSFFEVHNNSSDTIYLDGIYFAKLQGVQKLSASNKGKKGYDAEGKYDWKQAEGLEGLGEKANTDYVYAKTVIAFPGSGREYPLAPGKSKIVASSARNHKEPIPGQPVLNPELTVDLSRAHFEVYLDDSFVKTGTLDSDNPAVTNMVMLHKSGGKDFLLDTMGREAYILFRDTKENYEAYKRVPMPTVTNVTATTAKYVQIPLDKIIDGINAQNFKDSDYLPHPLPNSIDAGELKAKGLYSSEVFIRKVKDTRNGITRYQDTNNSSNDFERKDKIFDLSALD